MRFSKRFKSYLLGKRIIGKEYSSVFRLDRGYNLLQIWIYILQNIHIIDFYQLIKKKYLLMCIIYTYKNYICFIAYNKYNLKNSQILMTQFV